MTKVGHRTRGTLSIEGNASQHHVCCVPGKATRIPDISGECNINAATELSMLARSTLGTVPVMKETCGKYKKGCVQEI